MSEPGVSTRKIPLRVCRTGRFDAPSDKAPKYPCGGGDIGDIGDIFRKSLKLLDFLNAHDGDISGDIFGDGDIPRDIFWNEDFHAQDTPACTQHRVIRCAIR